MSAMEGFAIRDGVPYINDRAFPWAKPDTVRHADRVYGTDLAHRDRGFHLGFENGWTLSIQFGNYNYCSNYVGHDAREFLEPSPNAEIAAWDADGKWHDFGSDQVLGYQSPDDVMRWIEFFSTQPSRRVDV
jgi:hypothetical protein